MNLSICQHLSHRASSMSLFRRRGKCTLMKKLLIASRLQPFDSIEFKKYLLVVSPWIQRDTCGKNYRGERENEVIYFAAVWRNYTLKTPVSYVIRLISRIFRAKKWMSWKEAMFHLGAFPSVFLGADEKGLIAKELGKTRKSIAYEAELQNFVSACSSK